MDPNDPQNPAQNPQGDPSGTPPAPSPAEPNNPPAAPDPNDPGQQDPDGQGAGAQTPDPNAPNNGVPRGQRRIQQLSEKLRQANQPNQPISAQQSPQFPVYEDGQQVSTQQLQQDVVQTAGAIAQLQVKRELEQQSAINHFERDTELVPRKYDELNPDSPSFSPELDEAIALEYQERAFRPVYDQQGNLIGRQLDPSVRLSDIADRQMKAARAFASRSSANIRDRVNATADTTAIRPGGEKPAAKEFKDLTLEEMKAKVGYHRQ